MTEKNRNQKLGNKWNETFFQKKKKIGKKGKF